MNEIFNLDEANKKLRDICKDRINSKYSEEEYQKVEKQLDDELKIIEDQKSAMDYLLVLDVLENVGAQNDEYVFMGAITSTLVSYLIDISDIDPFDESIPAVYSEFCYGLDGGHKTSFELRVNLDLYDRLVNYFETIQNSNGKDYFIKRYDDHGKLIGAYIEINLDNGIFSNNSFLFMPITEPTEIISDEIIRICKPKSFEEYVKCYGLTHGTGTWEDNGKYLINSNGKKLYDLIAYREDVYEFLLNSGIEITRAYDLAEYVRKGKAERRGFSEEVKTELISKGIPTWFIESCCKIRYLFPRSHGMTFVKRFVKI
ncbi:MAG: hypothetical protein IJV15_06850 [Lachnospiraceae bacterium]|nr:hypothetical protein [Lachnospiraceae bacterium]